MDNDVFTLTAEVEMVAPIFIETEPQAIVSESLEDSFTQEPAAAQAQDTVDGAQAEDVIALPGGGFLHFDSVNDPSHTMEDALHAANQYYGGLDGIAFQATNFDGGNIALVHEAHGFANTGGWIIEQE